jgi:hypothetical protein
MSTAETTPFQPTLPVEGEFSDAEIAFIEDSPPGLFPENQDSNFGYIIRKGFTDEIQILSTQQQTIYNERFVATSQTYLSMWELEVGLPVAPTNLTIPQRRNTILSHLRKGPFTRSRRAATVENFITATFGESASFGTGGIVLVSAGVPLYSGLTSLTNTYQVVENIAGYSYDVRILNSITVDQVALIRELTRITPAGISFTITPVATIP